MCYDFTACGIVAPPTIGFLTFLSFLSLNVFSQRFFLDRSLPDLPMGDAYFHVVEWLTLSLRSRTS